MHVGLKGFSKYLLIWMIDYLTHRRQLVQIDDRKSDMATVKFGVPQGSILGPVIFNLYVTKDKLDACLHPTDGAISQCRRTKTSNHLW